MQLRVSTNDGVPIYLQIVNQVKYLVAAQRLLPGEAVPFSAQTGGAIGGESQHHCPGLSRVGSGGRAGHAAQRQGVYVSEAGSPLARGEQTKILTERVDALLVERQMNVDLESTVELLHKRSRRLPATSAGELS